MRSSILPILCLALVFIWWATRSTDTQLTLHSGPLVISSSPTVIRPPRPLARRNQINELCLVLPLTTPYPDPNVGPWGSNYPKLVFTTSKGLRDTVPIISFRGRAGATQDEKLLCVSTTRRKSEPITRLVLLYHGEMKVNRVQWSSYSHRKFLW